MTVETLRIDPRFHGPPRSGNGGYVCGVTARHLHGPCAVRLKSPPPLDTELRLLSTADSAQLLKDDTLIAEAHATALQLEVPPAPALDDVIAASRNFLGFNYHPFPSCFVCGPQRHSGDGMCLFPGPVMGSELIAGSWQPDASLADNHGVVHPEFLWAALDCPGAFVLMPLPEGKGIVLGELVGEISKSARAGTTYIVCAWPIGHDGKKRYAGTAVYDTQGELLARARATWIEIPLQHWQ